MKRYCVVWGNSEIRAYVCAESPDEAVNKGHSRSYSLQR